MKEMMANQSSKSPYDGMVLGSMASAPSGDRQRDNVRWGEHVALWKVITGRSNRTHLRLGAISSGKCFAPVSLPSP